MNKLTVIVINYNTPAMTEKCLRQIRESEKDLFPEIILIENGSRDEVSLEVINKLAIKLIKNKINLGFAGAVNQGLKIASGEYIFLLNSDVFIKKQTFRQAVDFMEKNYRIGALGIKLVYSDNSYQASWGRFPTVWREFLRLSKLYKIYGKGTIANKIEDERISSPAEVDWLTGGALLLNRQVISQIGLLDEKYFLGVEDIDYCYRLKQAGWQVVYSPLAAASHYHGFSSGGVDTPGRLKFEKEGIIYFIKKYYSYSYLFSWFIKLLHDIRILFKILKKQKEKLWPKKYLPRDATIALTYRCNSRCQMCNIWRTKDLADLPIDVLDNLSPYLKYINLTGGEPFLRRDLPEIVAKVKKISPRAEIIISSNGLATELIIESMKRILAIDKKIGVRISLDGAKEKHEAIRGVPGIYDRVLDTISRLKKIGVKNLGLSFTIMDSNVDDLPRVYDLSRNLNLQLAIALVQNSEFYFNKADNQMSRPPELKRSLDYVINKELAGRSFKNWLRAYYDYGLKYFALTGKRLLPSGAGMDSLFINPLADVYPSNLLNFKIGNILNDKLDQVWQSAEARATRRQIRKNYITESWIICTIREEMKRHKAKIISWIIKNKFKTIFGQEVK